jgi:hypothetical protein
MPSCGKATLKRSFRSCEKQGNSTNKYWMIKEESRMTGIGKKAGVAGIIVLAGVPA